VLPVSVVDVYKNVRGNHSDSDSSRSGFSRFPSEVSDLSYELFLRGCKDIFDPFAGWGERHYKAIQHNKNYTGYDISARAVGQAEIEYGVANTLADSSVAQIPIFDGLLTCPPYWNLEIYSDVGIEQIRTFDEFICILGDVFRRCFDVCLSGGVFCILVGNWRKNGTYYDLSFAVKNIFRDMGALTIDCVVISRRQKTKVKVLIPQAVRLGYTVNLHEELLVFAKP